MNRQFLAKILTGVIAAGSLTTSGVAGYRVLAAKQGIDETVPTVPGVSPSPSPLSDTAQLDDERTEPTTPETENEPRPSLSASASPAMSAIPQMSVQPSAHASPSPATSGFPTASMTPRSGDDSFDDEKEDEIHLETPEPSQTPEPSESPEHESN